MMMGLRNSDGWRNHSTPLTMQWLEATYTPMMGACIARNALYNDYVQWCHLNFIQPVNAASFGKIIRRQFPHLTTRRLGTRGQSKYHYYGLSLKYQLHPSQPENIVCNGNGGDERKFNMKEEPDKNHNLTFCTTIVQSFSYKQQQVIANDFTSAHFDNTFWRCGIQVEDEGINYYDNMIPVISQDLEICNNSDISEQQAHLTGLVDELNTEPVNLQLLGDNLYGSSETLQLWGHHDF